MKFSSLVRVAGRFGGFRLARFLTAAQPRILMYHRFSESGESGSVGAGAFEAQVRHIAEHYNPMTVTELASNLFNGQRVPRHTVVITVDDGYRDFYNVAWPILKKYGVPATFYVTTGFVSGRLWLWPDQLKWLLANAPKHASPFNYRETVVEPPERRGDYRMRFKQLAPVLLAVSDEEKHAFIQSLAEAWELSLPDQPPEDNAAATWEQLLELQRGGIEIGGHTMTHPSLGRVDSVQAEREIQGCSEELNTHLGLRSRSFCYPNGEPQDFVAAHVPMVQAAGFSGAVVAFSDAVGQSQRYAMRRHSSSQNMFQFMKAISGVELLGNLLRQDRKRLEYEN